MVSVGLGNAKQPANVHTLPALEKPSSCESVAPAGATRPAAANLSGSLPDVPRPPKLGVLCGLGMGVRAKDGWWDGVAGRGRRDGGQRDGGAGRGWGSM